MLIITSTKIGKLFRNTADLAKERASSVSINGGASAQTSGSFMGFSASASFIYKYNRDTESNSETKVFQEKQGEAYLSKVIFLLLFC